jgi:hypothetical protein
MAKWIAYSYSDREDPGLIPVSGKNFFQLVVIQLSVSLRVFESVISYQCFYLGFSIVALEKLAIVCLKEKKKSECERER